MLLNRMISFTTRPKRSNETDGKDYNFITNEEFEKLEKQNELLEMTSYKVEPNKTWFYGISKDAVSDTNPNLVVVNPHGLEQLKDKLSGRLFVFRVVSEQFTRVKRYLKREISPDKERNLEKRLLADQNDFNNIDVLLSSVEHVEIHNNETTSLEVLCDTIISCIKEKSNQNDGLSKVFCLVGECATGKSVLEAMINKKLGGNKE